jgi:nitrogen-specific signal transduction histidine kinase
VDEGGALLGAVLVLRDVSERRRLGEHMSTVERLRALSTLAAGVSHEINNPLGAIVVNAQHVAHVLAGLGGGPSVGDAAAAVADIQEGAERVRRVVADLGTFCRPDDQLRVVVHLPATLERALRMTQSFVRSKARIVLEMGPVPLVSANEARLGLVFIHLIENAALAISGDPYEQRIRISTWANGQGDAVVAIEDSGSGMSPEVAKRAFDPFFSTRPVGQGEGLGLAMCHGIVTSLGGTIELDSKEGRGTIVRVTLPAAPSEQARSPMAPAPATDPRRRTRVLVIDDEPTLVRAIERTLGRDHDVRSFLDPKEAVAALEAGLEVDAIVCDLMMPGMTGLELHDRAVRQTPALAGRFLFITGGVTSANVNRFLDSSDVPRLQKPFRIDDLREAVAALLR